MDVKKAVAALRCFTCKMDIRDSPSVTCCVCKNTFHNVCLYGGRYADGECDEATNRGWKCNFCDSILLTTVLDDQRSYQGTAQAASRPDGLVRALNEFRREMSKLHEDMNLMIGTFRRFIQDRDRMQKEFGAKLDELVSQHAKLRDNTQKLLSMMGVDPDEIDPPQGKYFDRCALM